MYRVAKQAGENSNEHPIQRFLVLLECREIMAKYCRNVSWLDKKFHCDVEDWGKQLREIVRSLLRTSQADVPFDEALSWFETELKEAWRK